MNFTIIGNCQADALSKFLLSNIEFANNYKYIEVKPIYLMDENELNYLYSNTLPLLDLLIIQPISDNYKNNIKYSTLTILNNLKSSCKTILFPSLYFNYYHPYSCYINDDNGNIVSEPIDYHDKTLIKLFTVYYKKYTNNEIIEKYNLMINKDDFITNNMLNNNLEKSLKEIKDREENYKNYVLNSTEIIYSHDFIKNNYANILLFYTINHPTKVLFYYISDKILKYLDIPLHNYNDNIDPFDNLILPIYKSIQNTLNFTINFNENDLYNEYLEVYKKISINNLIKYI